MSLSSVPGRLSHFLPDDGAQRTEWLSHALYISEQQGQSHGRGDPNERIIRKADAGNPELYQTWDVVSQYGRGQFLVMLINITRENCEIIERRISQRFTVGRQRIGVEYHVDCIYCEAQ